MPQDFALAFALMAFASSITPGPNNLMLMASGINYGFRASIAHMLGVNLGFLVLLLAVAFGLGELFARFPAAHSLLKWIGASYLLYLSWRIASSPADQALEKTRHTTRPLGFIGAAAFQWVNPKAWVMAATAFTTYLPPERPLLMTVGFAGLFALINAPCIASWTLFGSRLRNALKQSDRRRWLNRFMGLLLAASLWPMLA